MRLLPLTLAAGDADALAPPAASCAFCGAACGTWGRTVTDDVGAACPACPLCALPRSLARPRIDEEAALVWLPEMSQAVISTLVRAMHARLAALGERLEWGDGFLLDGPDQRIAYTVGAALHGRAAEAADRLGTASPRELGRALPRLPQAVAAQRPRRLSGLRLLPLGRLFEDGEDVYPRLAAGWAAVPSRAPAAAA